MSENYYQKKKLRRTMLAFTKDEHKRLRDIAYSMDKPLATMLTGFIREYLLGDKE